MKNLTSRQLAWLLQVRVSDAEGILINAEAKEKGRQISRRPDVPIHVSIESIEKHLNIKLKSMIEDIEKNFLKRSACRGWISEYPKSKIDAAKKGGRDLPYSINVPRPLRDFLSDDQIQEILTLWRKRYDPHYKIHFK